MARNLLLNNAINTAWNERHMKRFNMKNGINKLQKGLSERHGEVCIGKSISQILELGSTMQEQSVSSCSQLNQRRIISITPPEEGKLRSRKVVSRSRARPTGKYPSWKMSRMIQWESINELNAYRLLDANPVVTSYHEQPYVIRYELDKQIHLHYPDVLVLSGGSKELWEIKPSSEAEKHEYVERTELLAAELPNLGFSYRLVIAEDLAQEPRLSNALTILKFGRLPISDVAREQLRQAVLKTGAINWGSVTSGAFGPMGRQLVCRLVLEGVLSFDVEKPWTDATILHWVSQTTLVGRRF